MDFVSSASLSLLLAAGSAGIAVFGEWLALTQTRARQYRFVTSVRAARNAPYVALVCAAVFLWCSVAINARLTMVSATVGFLVGAVLAVPTLVTGQLYQPAMRLVVPVTLLFVGLLNTEGFAKGPSLQLDWVPLSTLGAACAFLWLAAYLRELKDRESWRD